MDWHTLGDVHYRKRILYQDFKWNVRISDCLVCGAPFGGSIAVICSESKDVYTLAETVRIYNTAGTIVTQIKVIAYSRNVSCEYPLGKEASSRDGLD